MSRGRPLIPLGTFRQGLVLSLSLSLSQGTWPRRHAASPPRLWPPGLESPLPSGRGGHLTALCLPPPAGTANGLARAPCSGRRGRVQSPRTGGETGRRKATHHKANASAQAHSGQNPAWRSPRPLSFPSPPRERARGRGTGARSNLPPPPPPPARPCGFAISLARA